MTTVSTTLARVSTSILADDSPPGAEGVAQILSFLVWGGIMERGRVPSRKQDRINDTLAAMLDNEETRRN